MTGLQYIIKTQKQYFNEANKSINNQFDRYKQHSARQLQKQQTKEITYENRIFNIKKKFTINQYHQFNPQKRLSVVTSKTAKSKHSQIFTRHIDNIVKNRRLLRRGVWQTPFQIQTIVQNKGKNRYKTQVSAQMIQKQGTNQIKKKRNKIVQSSHRLQLNNVHQLPSIQNCSQQMLLPIQLSTKYGSRYMSSKTTEIDQMTNRRNVMNRKLAVQIINYNLLGKWACSSMKI